MYSAIQTAIVPKALLWTGRIMSFIPSVLLLLDGIMKLVNATEVVEATVQLGYAQSVI